nr:hypothetical protein [uncultured Marinifilum sp.]
MKKIASIALLLVMSLCFVACKEKPAKQAEVSPTQKLVNQYAEFELTTDISKLSEKEKQMLPILMEVADIMEELFWKDAIGDKTKFLSQLSDPANIAYSKINYGPWDRLNSNEPFIEGFNAKPKGANFYPKDMTQEEFDAINDEMKSDWYTKIQRKENGELKVVPYHVVYKEQIEKAAGLLLEASKIAEDEGLKNYLELRSQALLTDDYLASDLAWMDMKTNTSTLLLALSKHTKMHFMDTKLHTLVRF